MYSSTSLCSCIRVTAQLMEHITCEADTPSQIWVSRMFQSWRVLVVVPSWMAARLLLLLYLCMDNSRRSGCSALGAAPHDH